ncbi:hypothetical protein [Stenotrophomonas sp. CC120222-04]|uniref:hypothetical protein n=1 Tax=Stenotrophomonas sp. CC120222-04 TaxID=1378088 RepID=UPI0011308EE7|nr:hypothetical protein [Stenotrophomonas sp. CC120222-04]
MSDWVATATLVATTLSALGAVAAATATYLGVSSAAQQRKDKAKAKALVLVDSYVSELAALRYTFALNFLVVSGAKREFEDNNDSDRAESKIRACALVPEVPHLNADWHNHELSIALNRLRSSLRGWELYASNFSLEPIGFSVEHDEWQEHVFSTVENRRLAVLSSIRAIGSLIQPLMTAPLMKDRASILEEIMLPHDGLDFALRARS